MRLKDPGRAGENGTVDEISRRLANAQPGDLRRERYAVNGLGLDFRFQRGRTTDFVAAVFRPWALAEADQTVDGWTVSAWRSDATVEEVFGCLSGASPDRRVKRWRGDFEHDAFLGSQGAVVLHRQPFRGVTMYLPASKRLLCAFSGEPDVSHCEHALKYPARTQLRRHGYFDLHGAAAVVSGRAVLFVGRRRSGKTTCALEMVARGARYLSNDLCSVGIAADGSLRVRALPHMLRLTPENVASWPDLAERARADQGNADYTRGMVYYGGKHEVYAPVGEDLIGSVVGKQEYPVGALVFPRGGLEKVPARVRVVTEAEAFERFVEVLRADQPLPDWLPVAGDRCAAISSHLAARGNLRGVRTLEFTFGFSDRRAFDVLMPAVTAGRLG